MAMERRRTELTRSTRTPILVKLLVIVPLLALAIGGCGGDGEDDDEMDLGDDGPPTADEIRAAGSSGSSTSPASAAASSASVAPASGPSSSADPTTGLSIDPVGPPYAVQLGAFEREANAQSLREALEGAGFPVWTGETGTSGVTLLRVRVGATTTVADARRLVDAIRDRLPAAPDSVWIAPLGTEGGASEEMMTATRALLENG